MVTPPQTRRRQPPAEGRAGPVEGRLASPILIGREAELHRLLEAATGPPAVAVIEGEAGVGKTRLVHELLGRPELRGVRVLVGNCHQLTEPFPLGPLVEALRGQASALAGRALGPLAGALRPLLPELSDALPPAPEPLDDPRAERHRVFRAVRDVLEAIQPGLLVVEDLHWADDGTIELLRFLSGRLPDGLTLIATFRREDRPDPGPLLLASRFPAGTRGVHLTLAPLDPEEVGTLVSAILGAEEVSREFASFLHQRTSGLPLAVEETIRLLREREDVVLEEGRWERRALEELEVPPAVRDSVLERVGRLSGDAIRILEAAAVLGVSADQQDLARMARLPEARATEALSEAVSAGLLRAEQDGELAFRHVLAREAVYDAIPGPRRRRLHLLAALALKAVDPKPAALLAHHYRFAGRVAEWLRYAEAAADLSRSLGDDSAAFRFLRDALEAADLSPSRRARLVVKMARAAAFGFDHREALKLVAGILQRESLPAGSRGELRMVYGLLLRDYGNASAAYTQWATAAEELRERPALAARAMKNLAFPWVRDVPLSEHLRWLDRAVRIAVGQRDRVLRTSVLADRAAILLSVGDPAAWDRAEEIPDRATSAEEDREIVRGWANLADSAVSLGHLVRAEELVARVRGSRYARIAAAVEVVDLSLRWATGRWEGLEAAIERLLRLTGDTPHLSVDVRLVQGLLLLARGRVTEAEGTLRSVASVAPDTGSIPVMCSASAALARVALCRGRPEAARKVAVEALDVVRNKDIWTWATDAAPAAVEALVACGMRTEADEVVRGFARGLRGREAPAARAALGVCRGTVLEAAGDHERGARAFSRAAALWRGRPRPHEAARAAERAAGSLLGLRHERGEALARQALEAFESLGATWDAARVIRMLRVHGIDARRRRGRRSYGEELSPREREVARLASAGKTNREIAEVLFLSKRTVEGHVANAMRKLGVSARDALAPDGHRKNRVAPYGS